MELQRVAIASRRPLLGALGACVRYGRPFIRVLGVPRGALPKAAAFGRTPIGDFRLGVRSSQCDAWTRTPAVTEDSPPLNPTTSVPIPVCDSVNPDGVQLGSGANFESPPEG